MKKKPGLLWLTLALLLIVGIFMILPNYQELMDDKSIYWYFGPLAIVVVAIIYTLTQKA
jgi:hypothetical protein